jgi:hypothetical protein
LKIWRKRSGNLSGPGLLTLGISVLSTACGSSPMRRPTTVDGAQTVPKAAAPAKTKEISEKCAQLYDDWKRTRDQHLVLQAVRVCEQLARSGSARGQFMLARILRESGLHHEKNPASLLAEASAQGHPLAQYELAQQLLSEDGTSRVARDWLASSACSGYPPALRAIEQRAWQAPTCPPHELTLDGTWAGTVPLQFSTDDLKNSAQLVIVIDGDSVRVQGAWGGRLASLMPSAMKLRRLKNSAVVHGMADGWDDDGNWFESYVLVLTVVGADSLDVVFARQVNNSNLKQETDNATFVAIWHGQLNRGDSHPAP